MKASAEKSSTTTSAAAKQAALPFFTRAGGGGFFEPAVQRSAPVVQMKMTVNTPGDKLEQEADKMADKVMRMPAPPAREEKIQRQAAEKPRKEEEKLQRAALPEEREKVRRAEPKEEKLQRVIAPEEKIQKKEEEKLRRKSSDGTPVVSAGVQSAIQNRATGGRPLPGDVRSYMEPRFGADFSTVRIHSDPEAASLSNRLSARAFTYRNHIFFSRDQFQPGTGEGKQLLAHELTHTIQQGHALQRSPQVSTKVTPPLIQRLGVQDALDYFAERAYHIPGFRMLTIVLGFNPINRRSTDRSAANILRALIELIPGGHFITQALDNHGIFNRVGAWVEQRLATLGDIGSNLLTALRRFLDSLSWRDIFNLSGLWERARNIFTEPVSRLISFAGSVVSDILRMVKDAILRPLAALAQGTRGYDLLKALLGQDPITGEPVPQNADTLIGGFMKLIGQEEIWENIKRGNAVARAWAWFQGALSGLMAFARSIPRRIIETITSLTFQDVITVAGAFSRVVRNFASIAGEFFSWAMNQVIGLLEILFSVVAPGAMPFLRRAAGAFQQILRNPVGFVGNLVRAGVQGFRQFANNILTHLRAGLIGWLTGALTGLTLPSRWDFRGILSLVLQILGLTWQNVRGRLVRVLGERTVAVLETTFGLVVTLVREGPAAAWRELMQHLGNLQEMVFGQIREWVQSTIVRQAVLRIASMLNPAGAVIQAIIAIYNTIMFFVERMRQIGAVVESVVNSLSAIASGAIGQAANAVEQTMARLVPVVISFLARLIGLGGISERVQAIMRSIQQPINNAIDRVIDWIVAQARRLGRGVAQAGVPQDPNERLRIGTQAALRAVNRFSGRRVGAYLLRPLLNAIKIRYQFRSLDIIPQGQHWSIRGEVNPIIIQTTTVIVLDNEGEAAQLFRRLAVEVEQEFFTPLYGRTARDLAQGGIAQLQGRSSAEIIQARRGLALEHAETTGGQGLPAGRIQERVGAVNVSGVRNPSQSQPHNIFLGWLHSYGRSSPVDILSRIDVLRARGLSDFNISRLLQETSTSGQPPSAQRLVELGYTGPASQINVTSNFIVRLTRLVFQVEPLRFMERGFDEEGRGLPRQPIAITTGMGHQLVQSGTLGFRGLDQILSSNSQLNPAAQLPLSNRQTETIARSALRISNVVEQVRVEWSRWQLQTQQQIAQRIRQVRPDVNPSTLQLVPTRQEMLRILEQFYGQANNLHRR